MRSALHGVVEGAVELDVARLVRDWRREGRPPRASVKLRLRGGVELRITYDIEAETVSFRADDGTKVATRLRYDNKGGRADCPSCWRSTRYLYKCERGFWACRFCAGTDPGSQLRHVAGLLHDGTRAPREALREGRIGDLVLKAAAGGESWTQVRQALELEGQAQGARWASLEPCVVRRRKAGQLAPKRGPAKGSNDPSDPG